MQQQSGPQLHALRARAMSEDSMYMRPRPHVEGLTTFKVGAIVLALAVLFAFLFLPLGFGSAEYKGEAPAQRCAALVMFVAVLWATDAVPSYITSLSVPVIAVILRVMCVPRDLRLLSETDNLLVPASYCNSTNPLPGHPMHPKQAAVVASGAFFNPVILLFLCGFTMSAVLTKFGLSRRLARMLLSRAGNKPGRQLTFVMVLCICIASVLNNVPAAVLGASLLAPSFAATTGTTWPKFSLLGVAYSCNIGGMISPIASPQNVIAIIALTTATKGEVSLSFVQWFAVGIPFCIIATLASYFVLLKFYGAGLPAVMPSKTRMRRMSMAAQVVGGGGGDETDIMAGPGNHNLVADLLDTPRTNEHSPLLGTAAAGARLRPVGPERNSLNLADSERSGVSDDSIHYTHPPTRQDTIRDVVIVSTIVVTVALWVLFNQIETVFGNIGLIALIPILLFGSLGYITKQDFNNLSWDTLMLLGGGLSLGTVVDSSGLLLVVGDGMSSLLEGAPVFVVLLAFSTLVAVLANFISSTVSAVLLLPVIATVGVNAGHPRMLVILCVFMTSGAMGLAVSSFPNANSASVRLNGQSLADNKDFIKTGFPLSFVILVLVNTVGFGLCSLYGF